MFIIPIWPDQSNSLCFSSCKHSKKALAVAPKRDAEQTMRGKLLFQLLLTFIFMTPQNVAIREVGDYRAHEDKTRGYFPKCGYMLTKYCRQMQWYALLTQRPIFPKVM